MNDKELSELNRNMQKLIDAVAALAPKVELNPIDTSKWVVGDRVLVNDPTYGAHGYEGSIDKVHHLGFRVYIDELAQFMTFPKRSLVHIPENVQEGDRVSVPTRLVNETFFAHSSGEGDVRGYVEKVENDRLLVFLPGIGKSAQFDRQQVTWMGALDDEEKAALRYWRKLNVALPFDDPNSAA